ncbi:MAG: hypothetical protein QM673_17410, partial [Gordonia sp. (in: high G+C Gram-positive bacteria)]
MITNITHPVVKKHVPPVKKPAPTYQERQERIAESKRSLLRPLAENEGKATTCVSGEFTTLSVVFDSIMESLLPTLPPQVRAAAAANQDNIRAWMAHVHVSTLSVSEHPLTLGADMDDPKYRTPLSELVVNDLLKIRDGKQNETIAVENITLTEAVESVWLYVFVGVLAPIRFGLAMLPSLGSPFTDAVSPLDELSSYITYNNLLSLAFTASRSGLAALYQGIASSFLNQCVARVTDEQKDAAGRPSETVKYHIPISPLVQGAANQLALADKDTCAPIGDQTLARIVERVGESAKATAANDNARRQIDAQINVILRQMESIQVPLNLIPADPADFNSAEQLASFFGDWVPYLGGAPIDILIGLGHNRNEGKNFGQFVSLHDLTVTKSLTAAYFAYALSLYLFKQIGSILIGSVTLDSVTISPTRMIAAVLSLPLLYGLVTFHHVLRSTCFREDDLTGTGLGAEANKKAPAA